MNMFREPAIGMLNPSIEVCVDAATWRVALKDIGKHDFVHTYDFHRISADNGEGEPIAFIARDHNKKALALWPALLRRINGSEHHDLGSVYGYGGPVFAPKVQAGPLIKAIQQTMADSGAVSLFSRMHPLFIEQIQDYADRGRRLSDVVVIAVAPHDKPPLGYRGSHRREIVKGLAAGLEIVDGIDGEAIAQFKAIYNTTMQAIGAREYYSFSDAYYSGLIESQDFCVELLRARYEGECISAALFVRTGTIVQYYLSGTLPQFRQLAPSKALIAEAHRRAAARGVQSLVLGGGLGSAHDLLFRFKAGFSDRWLPFHVTRVILDEHAYDVLCAERGITQNDTPFFPAYRT